MEPTPTIEQTMQQALRLHQAGQLPAAARCLEQILRADPHHAPALHLLGTLAAQAQQPDLAISFLQKAIASNPQSPLYLSTLGSVYHAQGIFSQAEAHFALALHLAPNQAEILANLALARLALGNTSQAIDAYRQAIALKPDLPELHFQLGNALQSLGSAKEAILSYQTALKLRPAYAEALCNLGILLTKLGHFDQALPHLEHALSIQPNSPEAHNAYAAALQKKNNFNDAAAHFQQAINLKPNYVQALSNYGTLLNSLGWIDEAVSLHQRALALEPNNAEAHNSLGNALGARCNFDEAIAHFQRAIDLKPSLTEANYNRAMVELHAGNFLAGWQHYEWRWHSDHSPLKKRNFAQPQWRGQPLDGATILLHAEQGLGDTLQFLRYVPMVQKAGGKVILELPPRLLRIAAQLPDISRVVPQGDTLPPFDWHCPLLSLPLALGTTLQTIPTSVPYLSIPADALQKAAQLPCFSTDPAMENSPRTKAPQRSEETQGVEAEDAQGAPSSHAPCAPFISAIFAEMNGKAMPQTAPLAPALFMKMNGIPRPPSAGLRVGLAWAGKPTFAQDRARHRSMDFSLFYPLLKVEGTHFFSLQIGEASLQLPAGLQNLTDLSPYVTDMADTAAHIAHLDLVISVDTAVAHLAGALGVRTWLLLPFASDWRWLHARSDSPWYPTMRLFQQHTPGDWPSAIADLFRALTHPTS